MITYDISFHVRQMSFQMNTVALNNIIPIVKQSWVKFWPRKITRTKCQQKIDLHLQISSHLLSISIQSVCF